jgi:catechol 2,3-dioxygenase-like lactoylglutathione lyase family enzyme
MTSTITLNHTILVTHDATATAKFLIDVLGLPAAEQLGHFTIVRVGPTSLDLVETEDTISSRHFAFLVSEAEFDAIFSRIEQGGLHYWADPFHNQPGRINYWDDGRGVYFDDPNGHLLEIITRPYGSGGLAADCPNPLLTA